MVHFVSLFQATKNGNSVGNCWFPYIHLLEASFERWVFLYILAILIESGGTHHAQFATCQHGFNHVAGVHRTFRTTSTYKHVHLVDEGDDLAIGVCNFFQHCLEALFKFTAILCASQHCTDVERHQTLFFQTFRNITVCNTARQTFNDGGLSNTWLAN